MLSTRPPIIVILGHVDHGKTSLLDYLRQSHVAAGEAGGITQHISAFQLNTKAYGLITFIDTPGHAAFSAMRSRGSHLADIAILVIAADDGVMPQTKESIQFIKDTGIPYLVAITKIDLPGSDPARIKTQLSELGVFVEGSGGNVPCVNISVKTGQGINDLLETLSLLSQLHPKSADSEDSLECQVIESRLDSQKGPLSRVLVYRGTLRVGQILFQAAQIGKVKTLFDSLGQRIEAATPSTPVEILGLTAVPEVGSFIYDQSKSSLPSPKSPPKTSSVDSRLKIILKTDTLGSLEAISVSLDPAVEVLSRGVGDINENDIHLAANSQALVLGFNVKAGSSVAKLAEVDHVALQTFKIIYELIDFVVDHLQPQTREIITGQASILAEFKFNSDRVAGCKVTSGTLVKADKFRLLRGQVVLGEARFRTFKQGKNDITSAKSGQEFGAVFSPRLDFKVGDTIIAFTTGHGST